MKKRKRRSIAVSSAASRKAWRTRKRMKSLAERMDEAMAILKENNWLPIEPDKTIDRIPKVKWS